MLKGPPRPPLSAPTRGGLQRGILPALVGRVDIRSRRDDLVDAVQNLRGELDLGRAELGLELLLVRGPMIAAVTAGWRITNARARWISETRLLREPRERIGSIELALVGGSARS